jgi:hypothetical protein
VLAVEVYIAHRLSLGSRLEIVVALTAVVGLAMLLYPRQAMLASLALLPFADVSVPAFDVPIDEAAIAAVVLILLLHALATRDSFALSRPPVWLVVVFGLVAYLLLVSTVANDAWSGAAIRRFGHLGFAFGLALILVARPLPLPRVSKALLAGLLACGLAGLVMLVFSDKPTDGAIASAARLSGPFGDPNVAGFYTVVLGTAALGFVERRRLRTAVAVALLAVLVATLSRTALLAAGIVLVWLVTNRGGRTYLALCALVACAAVAFALPESVQTKGPFESRAPSDFFRADVLRETAERAAAAPIFGDGPAPPRLEVQGGKFLPHNSYLAMIIEGGIFYAALWVAVLAAVFWKLTRARRRNLWLEAGFLAVGVIAINLGDVLLNLPTMVLLGLAVAWLATENERSRGAASSEPTGRLEPRAGRLAPLRGSLG